MIFDKFKSVGKDITLNIASTLVFIATAQLIVYPQIANGLKIEEYGVFLTIMGVLNTLCGTFGNSLNNVRIIMNEEYYHLRRCGDYNLLLVYGLALNLVVLCVGAIYLCLDFLSVIIIIMTSLLMIVREYLSVAYRLKINYVRVLSLNLILSFFYSVITGWLVFFEKLTDNWIFIFFFGEIGAIFYLIATSSLWKEPFVKTELFKITFKKYCNLIYMSFISGFLMYFDRNFLLPILGGEAVAIYFAATVIGKAVGTFAGPISGVLLSYFGQVDFKMTRRLFWKMNFLICIVVFVFYFLTVLINDAAVEVLYPSLYTSAKPYFWIAALAPLCKIIGDLANPTVLRYVPLERLSVFNTFFLVITGIISYFAVSMNGLLGFCYSAVSLAIIRVLVLWMLGDMALRDK